MSDAIPIPLMFYVLAAIPGVAVAAAVTYWLASTRRSIAISVAIASAFATPLAVLLSVRILLPVLGSDLSGLEFDFSRPALLEVLPWLIPVPLSLAAAYWGWRRRSLR